MKHSFMLSEDNRIIINGIVVPPITVLELLENGRIQMDFQKKQNKELIDCLKKIANMDHTPDNIIGYINMVLYT